MTFAVRGVFGLSILLAAATFGCDDGSSDTSGPKQVTGGTGNTATGGQSGTGSTASTGSTGNGTGGNTDPAATGVPLTPTDGWVDAASNTLGIVGAMFAYADTTSAEGMTEDFTGSNACITGTAAKVDMLCTPVPPATDCYGTFWGAAIGLNLNQPIDPETGMGAETPLPYDASSLKGFGFTISGSAIPASLRFKVENSAGEFCTPAAKPILEGNNTVLFEEVVSECWTTGGTAPDTSGLLKVAWQVVTNDSSEVPFDFCVSNVVAIEK